MTVLRLENLTRRFGGVTAVDHVTLEIEKGARHVIFGPNGAGKTTLFRLVSGELAPSAGRIYLAGADVTRQPVWKRARQGLGRTFQVTNLFQDLSVRDSVLLAVQADDRKRFSFLRSRHRSDDVSVRVGSLLEEHGLEARADVSVSSLAYGEQRILEIVLALAGDPAVLLLDEPSAGLPMAESNRVMEHVRALPPSIAVVLIEHDLKFAFGLAETATVLSQGRIVAEGSVETVREDPAVQELYLGKEAR